jgi:hypothetical protein
MMMMLLLLVLLLLVLLRLIIIFVHEERFHQTSRVFGKFIKRQRVSHNLCIHGWLLCRDGVTPSHSVAK